MLSVCFVSEKDQELPLNIYGTGIYSPEQRGAQKRIGQNEYLFNSQNMGVMKASMPLPQQDIALTEQTIGFLRSADRTSFSEGAEWVKRNFEMLVHPFSNSISGTMLCQLRMLLHLQEQGKLEFKNAAEISNILECITCSLLYSTGGHTLIEFMAPMSLLEVKTAFSFIKDFDKMNLEALFFEKNDAAFNVALQRTMDYNKIILQRTSVLKSIPERWATLLGESVSLTSAIEASQYYLGELSSIDMEKIANNSAFIARQDIHYVMVHKDEHGDIKRVPITARAPTPTMPGGFDLLDTNIILTNPNDFDKGLETIGRDHHLMLLNYLKSLPKSVQKFLKVLESTGGDLEAAVNPALLTATRPQDLDFAKWLLKGKIDVNIKNDRGETPLLLAASSGNLELVKLLVKRGADVNSINKQGFSVLERVAAALKWDVVEFLIKQPTFNLDVNGPNARALKIPEVAKLIQQHAVSKSTEMTPQTTLVFSNGGSESTIKTEDTKESTKKKGPTTKQ